MPRPRPLRLPAPPYASLRLPLPSLGLPGLRGPVGRAPPSAEAKPRGPKVRAAAPGPLRWGGAQAPFSPISRNSQGFEQAQNPSLFPRFWALPPPPFGGAVPWVRPSD